MTMQMLREEMVEASVLRAITAGITDYGAVVTGGSPNLAIREAFPTPDERAGELNITTLAFGFNIDDGGEPAEMGSTLTRYTHTLVCWTFAIEPRFGRHIAQAIMHVARRNNDIIPLLDFSQDGDPVIDGLNVMKVQVRHQVNQSPRPWDRYVWTTSISVRDTAYPA